MTEFYPSLSDRLERIRQAAARHRQRTGAGEPASFRASSPSPLDSEHHDELDPERVHDEESGDVSVASLGERWRHTLDRDHES